MKQAVVEITARRRVPQKFHIMGERGGVPVMEMVKGVEVIMAG
jgi:hypothetical protein